MTAYEAAEILHNRRLEIGRSTTQLAKDSSIVRETVRNIESHRTIPRVDVFFDMLYALGLEVRIVPKGAE